jgi:transcriptional regulator with XRE-family HTH domain
VEGDLMDNQQVRLEQFVSSVGQAIRETREHLNLSLRKLSESTGLSHRAIWKVEHGKTDPRLSTLFLLSEALESAVWDWMHFQPDPTATDTDSSALRISVPSRMLEGLDEDIADALTGWLKLTLTREDALDNVIDALREAVIKRQLIGEHV